ncbi:uncharacterized protein LOC128496440 [Spea bombifrons]|uniref:uncharacterized protein LOC128496440 n=1 Tax=Spea bombifrons TaxID=233779 RepID=UPI00234946CA|nr:uncharacterized protein LOC128496440 [Spea bombifrons]
MSSVGRAPRKSTSVKMAIQNAEESSPPPIGRVTIPKVPLTKKSKQKEPLALIRRKMIAKHQEIQEITILGCGEDTFHAEESPPVIHPPEDPLQEDELCVRFQDNEVATQTAPVYCFSTLDEVVEFLNGCSKPDDRSPQGMSPPDDPPDEPGGGEEVLSNANHMHTLKSERGENNDNDDDDDGQPLGSHLFSNPTVPYASPSSPSCFLVVKRRRKQRFHCDWQGPVTVISSPNVPVHALELRVDEDLAMSIRRQVDVNNPGPFGWQLAKLLFTEEELYGHNFNGTDQKLPLSPRRVHAIQHAFHDYFPKDIADEALAKGRTAINQGIRNMFYVRNRRDGDCA